LRNVFVDDFCNGTKKKKRNKAPERDEDTDMNVRLVIDE
jgi:hypothetical protein